MKRILADQVQDLINSSSFRKGSAIFALSRDSGQDTVQRFPFEPNANAQVVLGIYDGTMQRETADTDGKVADSQLGDLRSRLEDRFAGLEPPPLCTILAIGSTSGTEDTAIGVPQLDHEGIYGALTQVCKHFIINVTHLSNRLADFRYTDPTAQAGKESHFARLANGGGPNVQSAQTASENASQQVQKGRYTLVVGLLNMYVGSWPDAMSRLDEAAVLARQNEDSLWQARSLECLLVCMLLLAWRGIDFAIPEVCIQAYSTSEIMSRSSLFGRPASVALPSQTTTDAELSPIQKWSKYSPVIAQAILNVYTEIAANIESTLPPTILTESRIRVINLLIFASNEVNTSLSPNIELFLLHKEHPPPLVSSSIGTNIPSLLLAALPKQSDIYVKPDELAATIACVGCLSALGSLRRHAFILRGLLPRLAQTLVKARKIGASEAGLHPESALSAIQTSSNSDGLPPPVRLRPLLDATITAYDLSGPALVDDHNGATITNDQLAANLKSWCEHNVDGDVNLKAEILLACIDVCDALPDLEGRLRFTSMLLRLSVQSITVSASGRSPHPTLSVTQQGRLVEGVKRTAEAAQRAGLNDLRAPYWDDFLVRDIQVFQPPDAAILNSHAPSELSLAEGQPGSGDRDPFIFNPFARNTTLQTAPVVVAEELITFSVLLQNPLEVEVDVISIALATEGCGFEPSSHSVVLGPMCSQVFKLTGKALEGGTLKLVGCTATIQGCYPQTYPVLTSEWRPPLKVKQKSITSRRRDNAPIFSTTELNVPEPRTITLTVIAPQPQLEVQSSSLTQPTLMLLEGEKRTFSLNLKNNSTTVPSDFLLLSSNDNVSKELRTTLGRKDLQPIDTYEVQHQLKHRPVIQLPSGKLDCQTRTEPQATSSYEVEIWGRPGLTDASIHIDFAHLKKPRSEIQQTFHTRQARFPLAFTVNGSIDIVRCNVLPVQGDLPSTTLFGRAGSDSNGDSATPVSGTRSSAKGVCMLSLDFRNVWPQPLSVELTSHMSTNAEDPNASNTEASGERYMVSEVIQPGHINRIILLVPQLFVADALAPIPNLDTKRQFVVSASKVGRDAEAATRENFWYREALLRHVHGTWKELKTGRTGEIDLRKGIRLNLNARMIDVLRVDHVEVSYDLIQKPALSSPDGAATSPITLLENSHYSLQTEVFATLRVRVRNLSSDKLALLLRLQPALREQPHGVALDLSRRLAWSGVLQRVLHPPLAPGDERIAELGIAVLAAGLYEVTATVEEVTPRASPVADRTADLGSLARGQRRLWHARSPCLIDAVDAPGSPAI